MHPQPDFWSGRRVFVTGHTGFKGSWLVSWLLEAGAEVGGLALAPETAGVPDGFAPLFDELELAGRMTHHVGDIRDLETVRQHITDFAPEVVIHMAAQPLVRLSYREPVETYATNVMGTVHVLETCRHLDGLKSVVVVSSDKCYQNVEQIWPYRETDPMGGHDPYSNSKGCTELVTEAYRNSFFAPAGQVQLASGRAGNVIGGGDWSEDRLIPDAMRSAVWGDVMVMRNPEAVRPWQHVLEPISGYLQLAELGARGHSDIAQGWNFGPPDSMNLTVRNVLDQLSQKLDGRLQVHSPELHGQPHEAQLLRLDCSLAHAKLGWTPQLDATGMLDMTAQWYMAPDAASRRDTVTRQIAQFRKRAA